MDKKVLFPLLLFAIVTSYYAGDKRTAATKAIDEGTITNIYDAFSKDTSLIKDFGFSCITKYQGKTILFDAGTNADIFKTNTTKLGIDLRQVDIVVVSHGHFDHLNGMDYLLQINPNVKIYFPNDGSWGAPVPGDATGPEPEIKDSLPEYEQYFGGATTKFIMNQSGRFWKANIEFVRTSKEIMPGLKLVTTSSDYVGYFSCYPNKSKDDCIKMGLPELSLSMKTDKGEVLIVGCSHSGVEKIISETKKVVNNKIELVYGGFHMIPFDRNQINMFADKIKNELQVHRLAPSHCTGHLAFKILRDKFGKDYLYAGLGETIKY